MERQPHLRPPAGSCDCHMHIFEPRFPFRSGGVAPPRSGSIANYLHLRKRLGLERVVVVQASAYGTDNRCALAAIAQFGASARGVAIVAADTSDLEFERLHQGGMRSIRYLLGPGGALTLDTLPAMAARAAQFNWTINLQLRGETLEELEPVLMKLPCDLVIDHIGRFAAPIDREQGGVRTLRKLLDRGHCYVKLSAPYHGSRSGPPHYEDIGLLAKELVRLWPDRMLYASNWPHPSVKGDAPDDAALLDLIEEWAPDATTLQRILVDNPDRLYGFSRSVE